MSPQAPSSSAAAASLLLERMEASIMAESALIDKESGRVVWEGGSSSTLSASLYPKIGVPGFSHFKATVLTSLLFLALASALSQWVRQRLEGSPLLAGATTTTTTTTAAQGIARRWHQTIGVFLLQWTLFRTPNFDGTFVVVLVLLYLVEAYTCSTRRYLANAILSSTSEVEEYIEKLREEPPVVTWKVRCFHYEKPYWLSPIKTAQTILQAVNTKAKQSSKNNVGNAVAEDLPPVVQQKESDHVSGPFRRKVISHQAVANYTFSSFVDATTAGVWKRQEAISTKAAPFMKIILSKILVLANAEAKKDYFQQQSNFVATEGMRDTFAEYSTNIEVAGFKRRMLAIRPVEGVPSAKLFRLHTFWFFTMVGLSLPYRLWFARHCDYLRVTTVKETYADLPAASGSFSSWFTYKSASQPQQPIADDAVTEAFRQQMQSLLLYSKDEILPSVLEVANSTAIVKEPIVNVTASEENKGPGVASPPSPAAADPHPPPLAAAAAAAAAAAHSPVSANATTEKPAIIVEETQGHTSADLSSGKNNHESLLMSEGDSETSTDSAVDRPQITSTEADDQAPESK